MNLSGALLPLVLLCGLSIVCLSSQVNAADNATHESTTSSAVANDATKAPLVAATIPASASEEQGLQAFQRIYEVVSHPRCANCHVGADNIPMWSGPSYGKTRPHGMNITAGQSRIGAQYVLCSTCHRSTLELDSKPHAPPHFGLAWQLAPVAFEWFGKSASEICQQLKEPTRNGGRDWQGLVAHLVDDAGHRGPVLWGWNPGGNRQPAPYDLQTHVNDMAMWGVAGQPCP